MPGYVRLLRAAALAPTAAAVIFLSPIALLAQSSQRAREVRRVDMETRQKALWDLEKLKQRPSARAADRRPAYRDVAEDFEQLQLKNYDLSGAAVRGAPLDYAGIREVAAEVRKRASRLKGYLSLPEPDKGQKQNWAEEVSTPEGLRLAVASLDALVNDFVWNPVFRQPVVVDVGQSAKAGAYLEGIISLSGRIRRCAEALGKGAGKKH